MKLKVDDKGVVATKTVNGELMPVYIRDDGTESELDAKATLASINARAAQSARVEADNKELKTKLEAYKDIADPSAAIVALEAMKKLDLKKLVDAGEVDKVRAEVAKVYDTQIADLRRENESLTSTLFEEKVGGRFNRSKVIAEKFSIPADMVQARFGQHFGIEDGRIYAADAQGNKIFSKTRPGELADFDEALMILVDQYPYKDHILKGTGSSGGGASNSGGGSGGQRTVTRAQFDAMNPVEKAAAVKTMKIVD
jgi:hypothetical protein